MEYTYWFIAAVALVIIEILTPGFVILWFGVGAAVAGFFDLVGLHNIYVQIFIFIAVSLSLVAASRTIFKNVFMKKSPGGDLKTNMDAIIGTIGVITQEVNNELSSGRALVNGTDWAARSIKGETLSIGERIKVLSFEGNKLIVDKIN